MSKEKKTMSRFKTTITLNLAVLCSICALGASSAAANEGVFGLAPGSYDLYTHNQDGSEYTQAGGHPFAVSAHFSLTTTDDPRSENPELVLPTGGNLRNGRGALPPGYIGNPNAVPQCSMKEFFDGRSVGQTAGARCFDDAQVGIATGRVNYIGAQMGSLSGAVFNLEPPAGKPAAFGFWLYAVPVVLVPELRSDGDYGLTIVSTNVDESLPLTEFDLTFWGVPGSPAHDSERGFREAPPPDQPYGCNSGGSTPCIFRGTPKAFLTTPMDCTAGPLSTTLFLESWEGETDSQSRVFHDQFGNPVGQTGCNRVPFAPDVDARPTSGAAESPSGFDFTLDIPEDGILNPTGIAQASVKKSVVMLPDGMTINPSIGEGLGVCTPADYRRETLNSAPGRGCPNNSKIGTLSGESPLVEEAVTGSIFLAQQDNPRTTEPGAENPLDAMIALYFVAKNPEIGAVVKMPVEIKGDPTTGRLTATLEDIPQVPLSHFNAHLREGVRSALVTPPTCGTHEITTELTPWSSMGPKDVAVIKSSFNIGPGVQGCPSGGVLPFKPHFEAGSVNNNAGSHSPFNMRLIRDDGEQDMTKFSSILPPGEVGSLAGVAKCPDAAIAIARSKEGREELAAPSCPANSLIGHTLAGAGAGSALTYVKGQIYLGGPYHGDPLSVISVTPAVAGPFDAGTVVVRLALDLNPKTAEVEVDGANSDPIPHILKGIVLKVRDLRVYVDRPNFLLNPTSCDESSARATLFGSYLDVINPADDKPVDLSTRYQAANCLNLGFKPKLSLNLKGGTARGGHPGLRAIYTPHKGDANVKGLVVRLPRSAFLDQAHIRTICTRVQFAAKSCPPAAQYGYIKAWTPLLEEPLEGPVWLRSSNHKLPDLVFDLHGLVDVEVSTRIDSAKGGIRATLEDSPDAPLSKVELRMQGAKKGLIINSRNLCGAISRANAQYEGHNGKEAKANPVMRADGCGGARKGKRKRG